MTKQDKKPAPEPAPTTKRSLTLEQLTQIKGGVGQSTPLEPGGPLMYTVPPSRR
ncbi:MAG: hypothetical protein IPH07_33610 [Deltaproteobacteria bacterium]|nr:hypothetical protein [Deltaproteobacteria bacterium]MBK8235121.1 hypothetical protein [Deltaproteobacteria bacterium]MBK8716565.1 hypothetical protein [Deltaproteobacteria bacterium]MBP7289477.1 hypothetical protein [Nannocystaceae bacterium]